MDHFQAARDIFIAIPGEETEVLGRLWRQHGIHFIAQANARDPDFMPERFFDGTFIIEPEGKVIHKH